MFKKYTTTLLSQALVYVSGFLLVPIIVKTSGTEVYGGYAIVISLLGIIAGISSFGAGFSVRRFLPSIGDIETRAITFYPQFYFHILSSVFLGFAILLFFPLIEEYFLGGMGGFNKFLIVLYLAFYALYLQVASVFRYTHKTNLYNILTILNPYIFLVFVLLWYRFDNTIYLNSLIISQVVAFAVVFVIFLVPSIKSIGFKFSWYSKYNFIKDITYGFPLVIVAIFELITSASDRYVIAAFMDLDSVAYYTIVYSVGSVLLILPKVVGIILPPIMSKLKDKGGQDKIGPMINSAILIFSIFLIPFIFGTIMLGEPLLLLYANKETAVVASGLLPIIVIAAFFYGVGWILSCILFVDMKTNKIFLSNAAAGLLNLIANIIVFAIISDIYVAAWTTLFSYILYSILIYRSVDKEYRINLCIAKTIKIVLSSVIMAVALYLMSAFNFDFHTVEGFVSGVAVGCTVYFASLFISKAVTYKDLILLIGSK